MKIVQQPDGTWAVVNETTGAIIKGGFKTEDEAIDSFFPDSNPRDMALQQAMAKADEALARMGVKPPQDIRNEYKDAVSRLLQGVDETEFENVLATLTPDTLRDLYITSARDVGERQNSEIANNFNQAYLTSVIEPLKQSMQRARLSGDMTGAAGMTLLLQDVQAEQTDALMAFREYYQQHKPASGAAYAQVSAAAEFLQKWTPFRGRKAAAEGAQIGQQGNYEDAWDGVQGMVNTYTRLAQVTQANVDQMQQDLQRMLTGLGARPEMRPVLDALQGEADAILKDYAAVAGTTLPQDYLNKELPRRLQLSLAGEMGALNPATIVPGDAMATITNLMKGFAKPALPAGTQNANAQGGVTPVGATTVETATGDKSIKGGPAPGKDPFYDSQLKSIQDFESRQANDLAARQRQGMSNLDMLQRLVQEGVTVPQDFSARFAATGLTQEGINELLRTMGGFKENFTSPEEQDAAIKDAWAQQPGNPAIGLKSGINKRAQQTQDENTLASKFGKVLSQDPTQRAAQYQKVLFQNQQGFDPDDLAPEDTPDGRRQRETLMTNDELNKKRAGIP